MVVPPTLRALGNHIRGCEDLVSVLVEHEMVIAEMLPREMPMEVLGLDIEGEQICQQTGQGAGNVSRRLRAEVGRRVQRGVSERFGR
jgi:hypothetical protein